MADKIESRRVLALDSDPFSRDSALSHLDMLFDAELVMFITPPVAKVENIPILAPFGAAA